jgi:hypothetical protein
VVVFKDSKRVKYLPHMSYEDALKEKVPGIEAKVCVHSLKKLSQIVSTFKPRKSLLPFCSLS